MKIITIELISKWFQTKIKSKAVKEKLTRNKIKSESLGLNKNWNFYLKRN